MTDDTLTVLDHGTPLAISFDDCVRYHGRTSIGGVALGFRLILCTRRADSFARAREQRLAVSGNPRQYDDLEPFIAEQEEMRREVRRSLLPSLEVDVSDDDVAGATGRIADWLESTGGLALP